jgi:hypothetical protein
LTAADSIFQFGNRAQCIRPTTVAVARVGYLEYDRLYGRGVASLLHVRKTAHARSSSWTQKLLVTEQFNPLFVIGECFFDRIDLKRLTAFFTVLSCSTP